LSAIPDIRRDVKAVRAIVESGAEMPEWAINALWRWFFDQELRVPLPVMTMSEQERASLAIEILSEMDERFASLEAVAEAASDGDDLNTTEDGQKVNALWRELAGCYASVVNESVVVLTEEEAQEAYAQILPVLSASSGLPEEELLERIRTDGSTRMMLRRSGIDPDRLLGGA
jgi:hypothetical protein